MNNDIIKENSDIDFDIQKLRTNQTLLKTEISFLLNYESRNHGSPDRCRYIERIKRELKEKELRALLSKNIELIEIFI